MKRGSRFLIGFAAATLTFVSLSAAFGPPRFTQHCERGWRHQHGCHQSACGHGCTNEWSHGSHNDCGHHQNYDCSAKKDTLN